MGSIIDQIVPIAIQLGCPFTPKQMSELIYGDSEYVHVIAIHTKLKRLVNQGYLKKIKEERIGSQWKVEYEVIV